MALADFGVAFVIILGIAFGVALIARSRYQRDHPPLTTAQKTDQLLKDLADINKEIEQIDKEPDNTWDT